MITKNSKASPQINKLQFLEILNSSQAKLKINPRRNSASVITGVKATLHTISRDTLRRNENLTIEVGIHPSPLGRCFIALSENRICKLSFPEKDSIAELTGPLRHFAKNVTFKKAPQKSAEYIKKIFQPPPGGVELELLQAGTPFQIAVWQTLLQVPVGSILSYSALARLAGNERAVRATASAVANNQIAYLIPCHRIIRESGEIGNYRWGSDLKLQMLARELKVGQTNHQSV